MTREKENELMAKRRELRRESQKLIQQIVDSRLEGHRNERAITALSRVSREEVELTKPNFSELAAA
jgi:hypothetical protein